MRISFLFEGIPFPFKVILPSLTLHTTTERRWTQMKSELIATMCRTLHVTLDTAMAVLERKAMLIPEKLSRDEMFARG